MKRSITKLVFLTLVAALILNVMVVGAGVYAEGAAADLTALVAMPEGKGDVNLDGEVDYADYILFKKYVLRIIELSPDALEQADVNDDGVINAIDLTYFPRPPRVKYGDLNSDGVINSTDLTMFKQYLLGIRDLLPYLGDVNGDGEVNSTDLVVLRRYILKIIDKLPIEDYIPDPNENVIQ